MAQGGKEGWNWCGKSNPSLLVDLPGFPHSVNQVSFRFHYFNAILSHLGMRKILFFGSDHFSLNSFKVIHKELFQDHKISVACIPNGIFEKFAKQHNCNFINGINFEETFDIGIVASFGKFIPYKVISKFGYMLNIHPSLLPEWRGPAPLQRSIMNQTGVGVSIIDVHPKIIDAGDVYSQIPIKDKNTNFFSDLCSETAVLGAQLVTKIIRENSFNGKRFEQDHSKSTYAAAIRNKDALIDCKTMSANRIYNIYRAISHQETLHMHICNGKTIYLRKIVPDEHLASRSFHLDPEQFYYDKNERILWIGCHQGDKIGIHQGLIKGKSSILDAGGLFSALHLKNFNKL